MWYVACMLRTRGWEIAAAACLFVACAKEQSTVDAAADGTLLTPYLAIGDTLTHDRTDDLAALGALAIEAANREPSKPGVDAVLEGAARIGTDDLAAARAAFERMSTGVIAYAKADPDQQSGRMIVHCTMTFGGEGGAWVQAEGKVMNPYEGSRMLHCGDKIAWTAEIPRP